MRAHTYDLLFSVVIGTEWRDMNVKSYRQNTGVFVLESSTAYMYTFRLYKPNGLFGLLGW